jgi:hypothetical protein
MSQTATQVAALCVAEAAAAAEGGGGDVKCLVGKYHQVRAAPARARLREVEGGWRRLRGCDGKKGSGVPTISQNEPVL